MIFYCSYRFYLVAMFSDYDEIFSILQATFSLQAQKKMLEKAMFIVFFTMSISCNSSKSF